MFCFNGFCFLNLSTQRLQSLGILIVKHYGLEWTLVKGCFNMGQHVGTHVDDINVFLIYFVPHCFFLSFQMFNLLVLRIQSHCQRSNLVQNFFIPFTALFRSVSWVQLHSYYPTLDFQNACLWTWKGLLLMSLLLLFLLHLTMFKWDCWFHPSWLCGI